jgi:hypothetical protein
VIEYKVTCDNCQRDLTSLEGHSSMQRLALNAEYIPNSAGVDYGVYWVPDLERSHHFCGLGCLSKWLQEKIK